LNDALFLNELLDVGQLGRQKSRKILDATLGHNHRVFVAKVEIFLRHAELRIDGKDLARSQWSAISADIVNRHSDRVRKNTAACLNQTPACFFISFFREFCFSEDRLHGPLRFFHNLL